MIASGSRAVSRAYRELEPAAKLAAEYRRAADDVAGARELLDEDGDDPELRELLESSRERIGVARGGDPAGDGRARSQRRQERDRRDPPGAGGDEAGLWAGDLYRMLTRYAERRGFTVEPLSIGEGTYTFAIKGDGAYSVFKFEGGTHRVQRVPETESQGRIHTSTATVAVLPEAEDVEVEIDPRRSPDRRLPQLRPGRAVGQHDRLGRADHAQADRDRRLDAGREVPAAEPRARDARAARAAVRAGARRAAGRARRPRGRRRSAPASGPRRSAPTTSGEERVKDHRIKLLVAQPRRDPDRASSTSSPQRPAGRREAPAAGGAGGCLTVTAPAGDRPERSRAATRGAGGRRVRHAAARRGAAARVRAGGRPGAARARRSARRSSDAAAERFQALVARRRRPRAGRLHPRAQGSSAGSSSRSTARVLIPRPETELLVEVGARACRRARAWSTSGPGVARSRSR